jgi:Tol biopolymer transport system component
VDANWPRISPDGRALVFQAADTTGVPHAWLLRLDDTRPTPITGSEKSSRAYWAPDSREIVFVVDQKIMRLPVEGGTPRIVCPAPGGSDLSWSSKGFILMDGNTTDSLRVVPAGGGELRPATRIDRANHEVGSAWPSFLPDGEHFLFLGMLPDGSGDIRLGKLGSLDSKLLGKSDGRAEWAPGGWVLFVRGSSLLAQKLDLGAAKLTGEPITIVDDLRVGTSSGHFSVSHTGVLALQRGAVLGGLELHVADRAGNLTGPAIAKGTLGNPHFSPDGRRVLYESKQAGMVWGDVAVYDLERGTNTPLTFTSGRSLRSQWSPDGRRFAFTRVSPAGKVDLMLGASDGLGAQDSIAAPANGAYLSQWASAGNRLVTYSEAREVRVVPADGPDRTLRAVAGPDLRMTQGAISPDGRWLAGTILGAADYNIFVQSLTGTPGRWQISTAPGGAKVVWTKDGHELVYEGADSKLMAVDIDTRDGFHPGTPKALFQLPLGSFSREIATWATNADGSRFLVITPERANGPARSMEIVTRFGSLVEGH